MKKAVVFLVAVMACGGSDELDTSGLVGVWNGTGTLTAGTSSGQGSGGVGITASGSELSLGGLCLDTSVLKGTVNSATQFTIPAQTCPTVRSSSPTGCQAIVLAWTGGHGTIANNVLTIDATGSLAGCGQSFGATFTFNGRR